MVNSILIIVPHQDDELNIAGFLLEKFVSIGATINILYVTRGDFYPEKYEWRQKERDNILKLFGKIYFKQLDYEDNYRFDKHIFNRPDIREKIKNDIKCYITECKSDVIICIDYDLHADHRMVSFLFDISMCEVLKENIDYRPIVLKKFAYLGVWNGEEDYFDLKPKRTMGDLTEISENIYQKSLPNAWDDKICIDTCSTDYSLKFWKSKVYKAYKAYFTQCGFRFFFRASNTDIIYWYRNTNNLLFEAKIYSDTGETKYVNDFSIGNIEKITEIFETVQEKFSESAWVPVDLKRELIIEWKHKVKIKSFKLYQNFKELGHINKFALYFDNGIIKEYECENKDVQYFYFDNYIVTEKIKVKVLKSIGSAGIRELEMYDDRGEFPWDDMPFEKYIEKNEKRKKLDIVISKIIYRCIWIWLRVKNKIRKKTKLSYW